MGSGFPLPISKLQANYFLGLWRMIEIDVIFGLFSNIAKSLQPWHPHQSYRPAIVSTNATVSHFSATIVNGLFYHLLGTLILFGVHGSPFLQWG